MTVNYPSTLLYALQKSYTTTSIISKLRHINTAEV